MFADMTLAADERAAICDEFEKAGPDRPTLCEGWTTRDLLAHLLARERQPWTGVGMFVPALAGITEKAMADYAEMPWADMVALLRAGAPPWSPFRIPAVDAFANGGELFVHHEDVRRGVPGWGPRPAEPVRDEELWTSLKRMGRMLFRGAAPGVVLRRPSGEQYVVTTGSGVVTLVGEPGELVLYGFGREAVRVEFEGAPADVAALKTSKRGL
jgi:uncharacterized protein (TIGR03085 family)